MKLELGKIEIKDIRFGDKSCVDDHVLSINRVRRQESRR